MIALGKNIGESERKIKAISSLHGRISVRHAEDFTKKTADKLSNSLAMSCNMPEHKRWIHTTVEVGALKCTGCTNIRNFFALANQEPPYNSDNDTSFWVETSEKDGKTFRVFCFECMEELFND